MADKPKHCLSCNAPLSPNDRYCPNCGLETVYRNLSLRFLLKSFFEAFLNFDVKMVNSTRHIWIPNRITKTFLEGKREYHVHPFRFYFICLVLFFTLLSITTKDMKFDGFHLKESISEYEFYHQFDTLSTQFEARCNPGVLDSIKRQIYRGSKDLDQDTFFNLKIFNSDLSRYGISTLDGVNLELDSLYSKYDVIEPKDQYLIAQFRRVIINPESAFRFAIGNMIWGLILLTIIMGGVLKLLYIRHESYYIENLLHISNYHCLTLILFSMAMIVNLIYPSKALLSSLSGLFFLGGILYLIVCLHRYYGENIIKTFIKTIILGVSYWITITFIMLLIMLFSFAIF